HGPRRLCPGVGGRRAGPRVAHACPRAALTLWQKMGSIGGAEQKQFLSTHPSGRSRMTVLSRHLPETLPLYADALRVPMAKLSEYRSNMQYLGAAPVDNGDEAPMRPMVQQ
ncbi:hypothetical protein ACQUWY_25550, partial [Ralstonia pseudosolanacearum]